MGHLKLLFTDAKSGRISDNQSSRAVIRHPDHQSSRAVIRHPCHSAITIWGWLFHDGWEWTEEGREAENHAGLFTSLLGPNPSFMHSTSPASFTQLWGKENGYQEGNSVCHRNAITDTAGA